MKKILNYTLGICLLACAACDEDGTDTVLKAGEDSHLTASKAEIVLTMETAAETAVVFERTDADYGFASAVTYRLEVDKKSDNFESPRTLVLDAAPEVTLTVSQLNDMMLAEELPGEAAADVVVRIRADVSSFVASRYSNTVELKVTPYIAEPPYLTIYQVGDAAEFGWDANAASPMFRSAADNFTYTFTGHLNAGQLKILANRGQWAPMWGVNGSDVFFRETEADPDPGAFMVGSAGYYTFSLDILKMNYTLESYDEAGAPDYASVNIAGDFSGWALIAMANTVSNPHVWTLDYTFEADAAFKFVADGWAAQWGTVGVGDKLYGTAVPAGNDDKIEVTAGSYTLVFNDLTKQFLLIPQE